MICKQTFGSKRDRQEHIKNTPDCQDHPGISVYDLKQSIKQLHHTKKNLVNENTLIQNRVRTLQEKNDKLDEDLRDEKEKVTSSFIIVLFYYFMHFSLRI